MRFLPHLPHRWETSTKMESSTIEGRNLKYIKGLESDASIPQVEGNVTQIEGGILQYVRRRMGCETVTREVVKQAVAFEREMSRMQGW